MDTPTSSQNTEQTLAPEEKRLLFEWTSPSRPFKRRDKDFFTTIIIMAIVFIVILFFMKDLFGILVILSLVFLVYVLGTVPPEDISHQIYTTGIQSGTHFYSWQDLVYYSFDSRFGQGMLVSATKARLPGMIYMLLGTVQKEKIEEIIGTRLTYRETPELSWMDNAAAWFTKKVPLDKN